MAHCREEGEEGGGGRRGREEGGVPVSQGITQTKVVTKPTQWLKVLSQL